MRTRTRIIQLLLSLIIFSLAHRRRLATMPPPMSVKSAGASERSAKPNDDSHASFHSQCLAISQSRNTVCLRTSLFSSSYSIFNNLHQVRAHSRSSFGNVIQLVLSLSLAHSRRLIAIMLGHALTHSNTFPLSKPTINLWRSLLRSANYLSNLLQPQTGLRD